MCIVNKEEMASILKKDSISPHSAWIDLQDYWLCDDKFVTFQLSDGYKPIRVVIDHINSTRFKMLARDIILKLAAEQAGYSNKIGIPITDNEKTIILDEVKKITEEIIKTINL